MEELVKRINEIREHYKLSGRALAMKIDMKYTTINNYLNGTKDPSAEFLMRLKSTFLDISADWLLVGEGSMFKNTEPTNKEITKELADAKIKMLVQEGIIDRLSKILENKIDHKQEFISEKYQEKLG